MTERERFALINGTALGWLLAIIALLLNFHVGSTLGMVAVILGVAAAYLSETATVMRSDFAAAYLQAACIALVVLSYITWLVQVAG